MIAGVSLSLGLGLGLLWATISSLGWAGLDGFRKHLAGQIEPIPLLVLINLGLLPAFAIWWASVGEGITLLAAYAPVAGLALALQIAANVLFLYAVKRSPLSLTIPFLSLTPAFAALVAWLVLGEEPSLLQDAGIALVVIGALSLGASEAEAESLDDPTEAEAGSPRAKKLIVFAREPGAWMMMGTAACWGITGVLDKQALAYASVPAHALVQLSGVVLAALLWLVIRKRLRELVAVERRQIGALILATLAGLVALGMQLLAIQYVLVGVVETLKRAIGLISAVIVGKLAFAEAVNRAKILAVIAMIAGVTLLMWG